MLAVDTAALLAVDTAALIAADTADFIAVDTAALRYLTLYSVGIQQIQSLHRLGKQPSRDNCSFLSFVCDVARMGENMNRDNNGSQCRRESEKQRRAGVGVGGGGGWIAPKGNVSFRSQTGSERFSQSASES